MVIISWADAFTQCIQARDPQQGNIATFNLSTRRTCLAAGAPTAQTLTLTFAAPMSNFTVHWGNGVSENFVGPLTTVSHTYTTTGIFNYKIAQAPPCTDTIRGVFINQYNTTTPGIGFITPPAGLANKRCVPEDLTITNLSPGMNGYTIFNINWGDNTTQQIDYTSFGQSFTHTYQPGTTGCRLNIEVTYANACGVIPGGVTPFARFGEYYFLDIDSAAVTPADIILCGPTDVTILDNTKLNCLDSTDRVLKWYATQGFAAPLPFPGNNVFRPYNGIHRTMNIPASAFMPIPADSTYRLRMVIRNQCGPDSAEATIRIVTPSTPRFNVVNNNTCPGEQMNFANTTTHKNGQVYRVDFGDGTIVNMGFTPTFSHTYTLGGTYKVIMSVIVNGYGGQTCSKTDSIFVNVKNTVSPMIEVNPIVGCDTLTVTIKNVSRNTTGVVWRGWQLGQGVWGGTNFLPNILTNPNLDVTYSNPADSTARMRIKQYGRYSIRLRAQSPGCPEVFDEKVVNVWPRPIIRWRLNRTTLCLGQTLTSRDSSRVVQNDQRGLPGNWNHISWTLNMGDGTIYQSQSPISSNFNNVQATERLRTHTYTAPGQYWVKLAITAGPTTNCPVMDSVLVTVNPNPVPMFTVNKEVCSPGQVTVKNTTATPANRYVWTVRRGTTVIFTRTDFTIDSLALSLPYIPPGDSTIYSITLRTVSGTGADTCSATSNPYVIKVPPSRVASFQTSVGDGCTPLNGVSIINTSVGIPSDGTHTFMWNFGNGNTFTGENPPNQNYVNNTNQIKRDTIRLRIQDLNGCIFNAQRVIVTYPLPNAVIVVPDSVCHNTTVTFSATGNGLGSYFWSFNELDGTTSTLTNPVKVLTNTSDQTRVVTVRLQATTTTGCIDTTAKTIRIFPLPIAAFTPSVTAACGGAALPVSFDASGSVRANFFSWNFNDGGNQIIDTTATTVNRVFPPNLTNADRTYNVVLTVKSEKGCISAPVSSTIRIRPTVRALFVPDVRKGCNPLRVNFTNLSTSNDDFFQWFVNEVGAPGMGAPFNSNLPANGFTFNFNPLSATDSVRYVVTLVVRDDNGAPVCEDIFRDTITVYPKPVAGIGRDILDPSTQCSPVLVRFNYHGTQGGNQFVWNFGDGSGVLTRNDTLPFNRTLTNPGPGFQTYNVRLRVTNTFGCVDSTSSPILIRPAVSAAFSMSDSVGCGPLPVNFTNNSSATAASFIWMLNENQPIFFFKDIPTQTFTNPSATDTALYRISLIARGPDNVCADTSAFRTIKVLPKPQVNFTASVTSGCSPLRTVLNPGSTVGGAQYQWFVKLLPNGNWAQFRNTTSPDSFPYILENTSINTETFRIKLRVLNASGCVDSFETNIVVFPEVKPSFTLGDSIGCAPFTATFTNTTPPVPGTTFVWNVDSIPQFVPNPASFTRTFLASKSDTAVSVFRITLQTFSAGGCPSSFTRQVYVNPLPSADFEAVLNPSQGCSPVNVVFTPTSSPIVVKYRWNFGGNDTVISALPIDLYRTFTNNQSTAQTRNVQLRVTSNRGCVAQLSKDVTINPAISVGITPSVVEGCGPLTASFNAVNPSAGVNRFEWYVNGILASTAGPNFTATYDNSSSDTDRIVKVRLVVRNTSVLSCADTAEATVTIFRKPQVALNAAPNLGCSPFTTTLVAQPSVGVSEYRWFRKLSTAPVYTLDTVTVGDFLQRSFSNPGAAPETHNFKVVAINSLGCKDSALANVTVAPSIKAAIQASDTAGCTPLAVSFGNLTQSPSANTFRWLVNDVEVSNAPSFFNFTFSNNSITNVQTFLVQLVASNSLSGCPDTATQLIRVFPRPQVDFNTLANPPSFCSPVSYLLTPVGATGFSKLTWLIPGADTIVTTLDTAVNIVLMNNGLLAQTRNIELRAENIFGCNAAQIRSVMVNPYVQAALVKEQDSLCSPFNVRFFNNSSAGANKFDWYVDGVLRSSTNGVFTHNFVNNGTTPRTFTVMLVAGNTGALACSDTVVTTVTALPKPAANQLIGDNVNGCSPLTVNFSNNATGANRFMWNFGDGTLADTTVSALTHTFINTNLNTVRNFNVLLSVVNDFGCKDSAQTTVSVRPGVVAAIFAPNPEGCHPHTVNFSTLGSINANQYAWDFGDGSPGSSIAAPTYTFQNNSDTTRIFNVRLIADRNGINCPDTAWQSITVFPKPKANLGVDKLAGCQPLPVRFINQSINSDSAILTFRSGPEFTQVFNPANPFDTVFPNNTPLNKTIQAQLDIFTLNGCTDRATQNIVVNPLVRAGFIQSIDSGCHPLPVLFTNQAAPGANITWLVDGQLVSNTNTAFSYVFNNNDVNTRTFTVMQVVSSVLNPDCRDTLTSFVKVFPKPVAGILGATPDEGCSDLTATLISGAVGASSYYWNFRDGTDSTTTVPTVTHRFRNTLSNSNRTFNVLLAITNQFGCRDTAYKAIMVKPLIVANISASDTLGCAPLSTTLSGLGSVNANLYSWDFGDGTASNLATPIKTFQNVSDSIRNFTVRLIVDRVGIGCPDTAYKVISTYPQPFADFVPNPLSGCQPLPVTFTNVSILADSSVWTVSGNGQFRQFTFNGASFDTTFVNDMSTANTEIGVSLTVFSDKGCSATRTRTVTVNPLVLAGFVQNVDSGCSPLRVTFTNQSLPGNLTSWFIDGELVSNALNSFSHTFTNNGNAPRIYAIKLIARSNLNDACTDTVTRFVKVYPKPQAGVLSADPMVGCSPLTVNFVGGATGADTYTWIFGDGVVLQDTASQLVSHVFVNNNTINNRTFNVLMIANTSFGCSDTAQRAIVVRPTVVARITSLDSVGCSPFTARFNAALSTNANVYNWNFGDGVAESNIVNPQYTFTNNNTTERIYLVRLIASRTGVECADTAYFPVKVYPKPVAEFTPSALSGCQPLPVTFQNVSQLADSSVWEFAGAGATQFVYTPNVDTVFHNLTAQNQEINVRLRVFTNNGCTDNRTRTITVYPYVKAGFTQSVDSGCSPLRVNFFNGASANTLSQWLVDGEPVSISNGSWNRTFINNSTEVRTFTVMQVVRNNQQAQCTDTFTRQITVFPKPIAGVISAMPEFGCSPLTTQLELTPSIPGRIIWDFRNGNFLDSTLTSTTQTFVSTNPNANTNYNVKAIVVTSFGCMDTTFRNIAVSPSTTANIAVSDSVGCSPLALQLVGAGSQNANRFNWDLGNGLSSVLANPSTVLENNSNAMRLFRIRLIAWKDGFNCPDTAYKNIIVNPNPVANFVASPVNGCSPLTVNFGNVSERAQSSTWVFSSIAGIDTLRTNAATFDSTFVNTFPQPLLVRAELRVVSAEGCTSHFTRTITVNPGLTTEITRTPDGCSPLRVNFFNTSINPNGSWLWDFGDGSTPVAQVSPTHIFNYNGPGDTVFNVKVIGISNPAFQPICSTETIIPVRVFGMPKPDFVINPGVLQLPQTGVTINNLTPHPQAWSYLWDYSNGSDTTKELSFTRDYTSLVNQLTSTKVKIKMIATGLNGCKDSVIKTFDIVPVPPVAAFKGDTAGCVPLVVNFRNQSLYGYLYEWTFGDGTSSTEQNPSKVYSRPGVYSVSLRVIGVGGETVLKRNDIITVYERPDASFTVVPRPPRAIRIPEEKLNAFVRFPQAGESYLWTFGDGGMSFDRNPVHQYTRPGQYTITLTVTSAEGCVDSDTIVNAVTVEKGNLLLVPNAFTPRNDGPNGGVLSDDVSNDVFYPITEGAAEIRLQIFNRWGEFLYESTTLNKGWDGYHNGRPCKPDVYVYKIWVKFLTGETRTKIGDVTLLR